MFSFLCGSSLHFSVALFVGQLVWLAFGTNGGGMAYFYRLIFSLFLVFYSSASFSLVPASYFFKAVPYDQCSGFTSAVDAAMCSALAKNPGKSFSHCEGGADGGNFKCYYAGTDRFIWSGVTKYSSCPSNSSLSGTQCTCNEGYEEKNGQCIKKNSCEYGAIGPGGWFDGGTSITGGPPMSVCVNGCGYTFDGSFPEGSALIDGVKHYFAQGSYIGYGGECTEGQTPGAPPGLSNLPNDTCAPGQDTAGTINGQTVCVDKPSTGGEQCGTINGSRVCVGGSTGSSGEQCGTVNGQTVCVGSGSNDDGQQCGMVNGKEVCVGGSTGKDGEQCGMVNGKEVCVGAGDVNGSTPGGDTGGGTPGGDTGGGTTGGDTGGGTTGGDTGGGTPGGDTGTGEGTEPGEGEGGECEKNPSAKGCGGDPKDQSGQLYAEKSKSFGDVLRSAKTTLQASPIGTAAGNFFSVSGGGSCPTVSGSIPGLNASFEFDAYCSAMAGNLLAVLRGVLLVVAAFLAFRIAIE